MVPTAYHDLEQRWRLLTPAEAVIVPAGRRRATVRRLRALPPGTPVALVGGRRRGWLATGGRLTVQAEYLILPSLATPVAIIQLAPDTLRFTARAVLTVPSGVTRLHWLMGRLIQLIRALPWLLAWAAAGDRLVVGSRR